MKDERTVPLKRTDWTKTKTPRKRAAAVKRGLAFIEHVHSLTKYSWVSFGMKDLAKSYGIANNMTYFYVHGIIKRKGKKYRWVGPRPTQAMVEGHLDFRMTYIRLRLDRAAIVKDEMTQTFEALHTADKRVAKYEAGLMAIYHSLRGGYKRRSLTTLCKENKLPHHAGRLLIERGLIDRGRYGVCMWIGAIPDHELAIWLYGMLSEHHRAIYRSDMEKKQERLAMIDEMVKTATTERESLGLIEPLPVPSTLDDKRLTRSLEIWGNPTNTWGASSPSKESTSGSGRGAK